MTNGQMTKEVTIHERVFLKNFIFEQNLKSEAKIQQKNIQTIIWKANINHISNNKLRKLWLYFHSICWFTIGWQ